MLKRLLLFSFLIWSITTVFAQDQTMGKKEKITFEIDRNGNKIKKKVLIIPFDNKMYMSEIDRDIAEQSQLDFYQIRNRFRKNLNELLFIALNDNFKAFSMLNDEKELQEELSYIYYSIGYKYDVLEKTAEEKEQEKKPDVMPNIFGVNKKKQETKPAAVIQKGEIISNPNSEVRFMNAVISNPTILDHLSKKYGAEILIFINQMDIKRSADADAYTLADNTYKREIKIHYTIIDIKGVQIGAGAAFAAFPGKDNHITSIISSTYPQLVKKIISTLPVPPKTEAEILKEAEDKKKAAGQEVLNNH